MEGHFGNRPIPGFNRIKRQTVRPELIGKEVKQAKAGKKAGGSEKLQDSLKPITEQERKEMIRQSWHLKLGDPTD